jgi:RNA polymerase sigma-70 factor (sigma-E family)
MMRTAVFLAGDLYEAQDMLQTALLRTALRWRQASANPDAYLRQVLVNLARDRWRSSRRVREVSLDKAPGGPDSLVSAWSSTHGPGFTGAQATVDNRDELLRALRQLPARQRTAVVLRFWEELSSGETAALMGCTEGTVKSATSRGLQRLRAILAEAGSARPETEPIRRGR